MNRTRLEEVHRGKPVDGVLPLQFKKIADPKEVNWLSLNIEFCDGIGDEKGEQRWWRLPQMDATKWKQIETPRYRPGLPSLESPCTERLSVSIIPEQPLTLEKPTPLEHAVSIRMHYVKDQFRIFNDGKTNISIWAANFDGAPSVPDGLPRIVSPNPNAYYFFRVPTFEPEWKKALGSGQTGEAFLNLYLTNDIDDQYLARFLIYIRRNEDQLTVDTQLVGLKKHEWRH